VTNCFDNVIGIFDLGEAEDVKFIALEILEVQKVRKN